MAAAVAISDHTDNVIHESLYSGYRYIGFHASSLAIYTYIPEYVIISRANCQSTSSKH